MIFVFSGSWGRFAGNAGDAFALLHERQCRRGAHFAGRTDDVMDVVAVRRVATARLEIKQISGAVFVGHGDEEPRL